MLEGFQRQNHPLEYRLYPAIFLWSSGDSCDYPKDHVVPLLRTIGQTDKNGGERGYKIEVGKEKIISYRKCASTKKSFIL